jgi:hypothetical protein
MFLRTRDEAVMIDGRLETVKLLVASGPSVNVRLWVDREHDRPSFPERQLNGAFTRRSAPPA